MKFICLIVIWGKKKKKKKAANLSAHSPHKLRNAKLNQHLDGFRSTPEGYPFISIRYLDSINLDSHVTLMGVLDWGPLRNGLILHPVVSIIHIYELSPGLQLTAFP